MLQPRYPAATVIHRGFCRLLHGDVHYRTAGRGPVVLALHESPRSSLSMLPVIDALAGRFHVIAPDTPGYGLSDPLPGESPELIDFLDVIRDLLDAMGLKRVALYGTHTGAALATAFALRHPARVSAMVLDGLSAFTADEVDDFGTQYLTPYRPRWDGAHVMGLWSRAKDLYTWFPWYDRTPAFRLKHDPADIGPLQRSALGFFQSGLEYAKAYIHAAAYQPNAVMRDLTVPTTVIARPDDLIAHHLERLEPGPSWKIARLGPTTDEWAGAMIDGLALGEATDRVEAEAPPVSADGQGSRFVPVGVGWLHVMFAGPEDGPLRLLVPGLPGDPAGLIAAQSKAHPTARLVLISPPGCGWSDPLSGGGADLGATTEAMAAAIGTLGLTPLSVAGQGAGGVIADCLTQRAGWDVAVERLDPPAWMTGEAALPETPLLRASAPDWDGAHLTTAWFQLRDLQLYDVPPGCGVPVRAAGSDKVDLERLDRLFRHYIQGPECAALLTQVVDHLRACGGDGPDAVDISEDPCPA